MDMIERGLFFYVTLVVSWWWLTLAGVAFLSVTVSLLKEDDYTLSTTKAAQLTFVGLILLVPWVKEFIPLKLKGDFFTRWHLLELETFLSFTLAIGLVCLLFAPIVCALVLYFEASEYWTSSRFFHDMQRHGLKQALKWKLEDLKH